MSDTLHKGSHRRSRAAAPPLAPIGVLGVLLLGAWLLVACAVLLPHQVGRVEWDELVSGVLVLVSSALTLA